MYWEGNDCSYRSFGYARAEKGVRKIQGAVKRLFTKENAYAAGEGGVTARTAGTIFEAAYEAGIQQWSSI